MLTSVYHNVELANPTEFGIPLSLEAVGYEEILARASDYKVSVIKFSLPNKSETFLIENALDYLVKMTVQTHAGILSSQSSLFTRDQFQIFSINDFVDNVNRTMIKVHSALAVQYANVCLNHTVTCTNVALVDLNAQPGPFVTTLTFTTTFPVNYHVATFGTISLIFTSSQAGKALPLMSVTLVSDRGVRVVLTSRRLFTYGTYNFSDSSILSQNDSDTLTSGLLYQPLEPLNAIQISNSVINTSWKIEIAVISEIVATNATQFNFVPQFAMSLSPVPDRANHTNQSFFPYVAPAVFFDQDNKKVSLIIQDKNVLSSFHIKLSPKLFNALPFAGVRNISDGFYTIRVAQAKLINSVNQDDFNFASILPPDQGDIYKMLDISTIIIKSNMAVAAEKDATTFDRVLMSLDVSGTDLFSTFYQFVNTQVSTRAYQLLSNGPLNSIGISVFYKYRSSGKVVQATLPPFTSFTMLLKFTPNGEVV
jgi:hypothetical protein